MANIQALQPGDCLLEPMVLKVEPLTEALFGCVASISIEAWFDRAVLAQQTHMEMPIIRRAFRLFVPRGRFPSPRQIVETVPVDARRPADQEVGGPFNAPGLHLFRAEARNPDFGD